MTKKQSPVKRLGEKKKPALKTGWTINPDGSFDLVAGELAVRGCVPAIDDRQVLPKKVSVRRTPHGGKIAYKLDNGELAVTLGRDGDALILSSRLSGVSAAPA